MKILLVMNLSTDWIEVLESASFEAIHWSSIGEATAPDRQFMDYARDRDLVVWTHDLDFGILLALTKMERPSVVQIRLRDVYPYVIGPQVLHGLRVTDHALQEGALVTIGPQRLRVRALPFDR
jgi:predicted nuclease of predicted toxin-antitoxin system